MATNTKPNVQNVRALFARIGWMRFYAGSVPGDERPVGGGSYNKDKIGGEVYNFRNNGGYIYGYFQPSKSSGTISLERIDRRAIRATKLDHVLLIFVARRRKGQGQVIVGWYKDAEVLHTTIQRSHGRPRGYGYNSSAEAPNCVLLPEENRNFLIPSGKGAFGQTNLCYTLEKDGSPKPAEWIRAALEFVSDYRGENILDNPEAAAEADAMDAAERALASSQGQGFARNPEERKALEDHAMAAAKAYFKNKGFVVTDVSTRRPFDLLCRKHNTEVHVEVKGTTTDGTKIVLTKGEVNHACNGHDSCALFILHSIRLNGKAASGGKRLILEPWDIERARLTPVSYTYRVR